jgi:hypothetical protein
MRAFAYRSGEIGFGPKLPRLGLALPIASAPKAILMSAVSAVGRHGYEKGVLLVPGIPEAENDDAAVDALLAFKTQVDVRIQRAKRNAVGRRCKEVV